MKNFINRVLDKVAPIIPEFQDDLSRLDVMERISRNQPVPEKYLVEYGFDTYPVEVLERAYGI